MSRNRGKNKTDRKKTTKSNHLMCTLLQQWSCVKYLNIFYDNYNIRSGIHVHVVGTKIWDDTISVSSCKPHDDRCSITRVSPRSTGPRQYIITRHDHRLRRDVRLPRSWFADIQRPSSCGGGLDGCIRIGAGPVVAARADGRLSTIRQAQTPLEDECDQKPFEKSQESRGNGAAGRWRIWIRRYLSNINL